MGPYCQLGSLYLQCLVALITKTVHVAVHIQAALCSEETSALCDSLLQGLL